MRKARAEPLRIAATTAPIPAFSRPNRRPRCPLDSSGRDPLPSRPGAIRLAIPTMKFEIQPMSARTP